MKIKKYQEGSFISFQNTLHRNLGIPSSNYRMERFWEINGKPRNFDEAILQGMFSLQNDGYYHAPSIAYNRSNDTYEFMKSKNHPTVQLEYNSYYNNPEFQKQYRLVIPEDEKYPSYQPTFEKSLSNISWLKQDRKEPVQFMPADWFIDFLKRTESFKSDASLDKFTNQPDTYDYGYGFTTKSDGSKVQLGDKITKEEADKRLTQYITSLYEKVKEVFPDLDNYPEQVKYGLMDHAYRGGIGNFTNKSPKFTANLKAALADGIINEQEAGNIYKEMEFNKADGVGINDRKNRRFAMLLNSYNPNQNDSIGLLGGKKNTIKKTEYTDFANKVLDSPNMYTYGYWNKKPSFNLESPWK